MDGELGGEERPWRLRNLPAARPAKREVCSTGEREWREGVSQNSRPTPLQGGARRFPSILVRGFRMYRMEGGDVAMYQLRSVRLNNASNLEK